jgi:hypothetical protein
MRRRLTQTNCFLSLLLLFQTHAFHLRPHYVASSSFHPRGLLVMNSERTTVSERSLNTRRCFLRSLPGIAALSVASPPSFAVLGGTPSGEGGLPDGARQFDNVLRSQREWEKIGGRIQEAGAKGGLSEDEWKGIQLFLRKLYETGDDMTAMAKGLSEPKKAAALVLVKSFKEAVKQADGPAGARDMPGISAAQKATSTKLADFLAVFQDIPDEL